MRKLLRYLTLAVVLAALLIQAIPLYATAITMGNAATNRASNYSTRTIVDANNPANATGTITQVQIYATTDMSNCEVATFYVVSGNNLSTRDTEAIGSVTAGSTQSFSVNLTVNSGDYIGIFFSAGGLDRDNTGGATGAWSSGVGVDSIPCTNAAFSLTAGHQISLYATGSTGGSPPTVTTQAVSDISYTTATGNGNITNTGGENPSTRGICYSTSSNPPTTADSKSEETGGSFGTGAYTESLTSLTPGAHYYARAYATNTAGTGYGSTVEFDTLPQVPTVTTQAASGVTMDKDGVTGGIFNGNLTNLGDDTSANISFQYGFTTSYGSETSPVSSNSTGAYTASMPSNLAPGNTYQYRSKAVNTYGTSYGSAANFTLTMPTVNTQTASTASVTGNISNMGVASNATVYFQWGYDTGYGNTLADQIKSVIGTFTDTLTGFLHGITLHFRAVCEVGSNTAYGTDRTVLIAANATSEVGRFQPILPISGTTLPDRDTGDGSQDGAITWGTGLEATIGPILAPTPTPPATTPGGFLPTPTPSGTFGGNPPGTVGDTPVALYWFLITGFVILVISITLSWAMRRFGSGSLLLKALVVTLLMGILVAVHIYDWWMIVLYLMPVIAAMFASQDSRRA